MRKIPTSGPVRDWFASAQGTWSIGAMFTKGQEVPFTLKESVVKSYDALLLVDRTTAAEPVGGGKAPAKASGNPVRMEPAKGFSNLDLEAVEGWSLPKSQDYQATHCQEGAQAGLACLQVVYKGASDNENAWHSVMQAVDATPYRRKKVRLTGWVRTNGVEKGMAGLWMRVDRPNGQPGFFDNMANRSINATNWTKAVIEGEVASDATVLNIGGLVVGPRTVWFDSVSVEVL